MVIGMGMMNRAEDGGVKKAGGSIQKRGRGAIELSSINDDEVAAIAAASTGTATIEPSWWWGNTDG